MALPLVATFSSCKDDNPEDEAPSITVATTDGGNLVTLPADGGQQTVTVTSNRDWAVELTDKEKEWLSVTPAEGSASATGTSVIVKAVGANETAKDHSTTLIFRAKSGQPATLKVTQKGAGDEARTYVTIKELREMYTGSLTTITDDIWIKGSVISNYRQNNDGGLNNATSAKSLIVSDGEAGIAIFLASNNTTMALGEEIAVQLKDQKIANNGGALQLVKDLAGTTTTGFPNENVVKTGETKVLEAKAVTVADFLDNKYEAMYIALPKVQVVDADLAKTYATASSHTSINMEDINGNTFVLFSSKYSTFLGETVPQKSGTLKGIATVYNGAYQISLANYPGDVAGMTEDRLTPVEPELTKTTISELIAKMTTTSTAVGNYYIEAVVTTDMANGNYSSNGISVMTEGATTADNGILLFKFGETFREGGAASGAPLFAAGDKVKVKLNNSKIVKYRHAAHASGPYCREIELDAVSSIEKIGTATLSPVAIAYDQIENYQGMLVNIVDAQSKDAMAGQTWVKNSSPFVVNGDPSKEFNVYVAETATGIIGQNFKTGKGTVTGIAYVYGGGSGATAVPSSQVVPRTYADVSNLDGARDTDLPEFNVPETTKTISALGGNVNIAVSANVSWTASVTDGNDFYTSILPASGNTDETIVVAVKANETTSERTITVKVETDNTQVVIKEYTVTITQAGVSADTYTLVNRIANMSAGTYYLGGLLDSAVGKYAIWTGAVSSSNPTSNSDLVTVDYTFNNGSLIPAGSEGVEIELVAAGTNTYYIKVGDQYLYSHVATTNRRLQLASTPTEWVFTDKADGQSVSPSSNGIFLMTGNNTASNHIRSYKTEGQYPSGIVFFKKQ